MSGTPQSEDLFGAVAQSFYDAVPDEERKAFKKFSTKETMLQDLGSICQKHSMSSSLTRCCSKIAKFSNCFAPYFDIINIFVQVKPEYMALVWGSIRLIFQFGANHIAFLEKVSILFEVLSLSIPQYQQHYEACRNRTFGAVDQSRLVKLMKYVYEDVVAFCGEICLIFVRRPNEHKLKYNMRLIRDTVWRPFDDRFSQLQDRMRRHQELFDREMRVHNQLELTQYFEDFQKHLRETEHLKDLDRRKEDAKQKHLADERVRNLQKWIWNREHKGTYEKATRSRHPSSCDWLLEKSRYLSWRDHPFQKSGVSEAEKDRSPWMDRILCLQAKPGFGKTTLSTAIIDDLLSFSGSVHAMSNDLSSVVAFFHFDTATRSGGKTSTEAFRALAAQLIDRLRNERSLMDALIILFNEESGGQQQASSREIEALLKLILQQRPSFIVIDGIDECSDASDLLHSLWTILDESDCRVLLLSRPNVKFPHSYRPRAKVPWQIQLSGLDNTAGIRSLLRYRLDIMTDESLLEDGSISDDIVEDLSRRANGMFLWAKLLINYLECPALSPRERHITLVRVNLIEGLSNLYNTILNTLVVGFRKQSHVAVDIFKWISFSLYPLSLEELHTALAIVPGEPTRQSHLLANYPRCIQEITCALVEIDLSGQIGFIHLSLKEFLETDPNCHPLFSLRNRSAVHKGLATRCLSYLVHDIPEQPLRPIERDLSLETGIASCGGEARLEDRLSPSENRSFVLKKYPLVRYVSLCWPTHLVHCLTEQSHFPSLHQVSSTPTMQGMHPTWTPRTLPHRTFPAYSRDQDIGEMSSPYQRQLPHQQRPSTESYSFQSQNSNLVRNNYENSEFLLYGSASHMTLDTTPQQIPSRLPQNEPNAWIPLLSEFLIRRLSTTAWVEACWTFFLPASLSRLVPLFRTLAANTSMSTAEGREIWWIVSGLHSLSEALKELNEKHHDLLTNNPTLLWQKHIVTAVDTEFWPTWKLDEDERMENGEDGVLVRAGHGAGDDLRTPGVNGLNLPVFL